MICRFFPTAVQGMFMDTIRSKLKTAKIGIPPVSHQKLGVSSLFYNPTFIQDNNAVGEAHGRQPMSRYFPPIGSTNWPPMKFWIFESIFSSIRWQSGIQSA